MRFSSLLIGYLGILLMSRTAGWITMQDASIGAGIDNLVTNWPLTATAFVLWLIAGYLDDRSRN